MASEAMEASYSRMIRLLKSTGLYRLDGESAVEKEMRLYAFYFGELEEEITLMAENCFVDSIARDGFDRYRQLYSLPENISYPVLRDIVRKRLAVTNRDFTAAGVRRCMESGGFTAELTENFAQKKVTVRILSDAGAFGVRQEKEVFLRQCLPCHVDAEFIWAV